MKEKNIVGVKTTKIYCLPTCPAKNPLRQNVVYFETAAQAERQGYRPCKRCFPDFPHGKWIDEGASVLLKGPPEFDFLQCLKFLDRSPLEPCHRIENGVLFKLEKFEGEPVLLKIRCREPNTIRIDFLGIAQKNPSGHRLQNMSGIGSTWVPTYVPFTGWPAGIRS